MKKLLLSLIIMIFAAQLSAQSLSFKYEGETVEPGTTIDIVSDINQSMEIHFDLEIINTTDADINVIWEYNDTVNGTKIGSNYCCFGTCYAPKVVTDTCTVAAGTEAEFNGHCMFIDNEYNILPSGTVINVIYTFYDERNQDEKYIFNVNFKYEAPALKFKYEGKDIKAGSTIDIVHDFASGEAMIELEIINNTENKFDGIWEMNDSINGRIGTHYCCCFGKCFGPNVVTKEFTLEVGETGAFSGHSMLLNNEPVGTEITIAYTFYDVRNPEKKYTFTINLKYESTEAIADFNSVDVFSNAYPNPASSTVSFDYNMPYDANSASIAIYNMMGQEVVRQNISIGGSRADINVSDLNEGVYFYSLIVNNKTVKTNKFVVSR